MNKRAHADHSPGACGLGRQAAEHGAGGWLDGSWNRPVHHEDHHDTDPGELTVVIGGFAAAAGEQSLATGLVESVAQERGGVSMASGEAIFDAFGYAGQPGEAFAAADTFLQIAGADLVLRWDSEGSGISDGQAWAHSQIDYLAIDVAAWSPAQPIVVELDHAFASPPLHLDGGPAGFAAVLAAVEVHGADTLSLASTYAFTDHQFSFVQAMALASL